MGDSRIGFFLRLPGPFAATGNTLSHLAFVFLLLFLCAAPAAAERSTPGVYEGASGTVSGVTFVKSANENEFELNPQSILFPGDSDVRILVQFPRQISGGEFRIPTQRPFAITLDEPLNVRIEVIVKWRPPVGSTLSHATIAVTAETKDGGHVLDNCHELSDTKPILAGQQMDLRAVNSCSISHISLSRRLVSGRVVIQAYDANNKRRRHSDTNFRATYSIQKATDYVTLGAPTPAPADFLENATGGQSPRVRAELTYLLSSQAEADLYLVFYKLELKRERVVVAGSAAKRITRIGTSGQEQKATFTVEPFTIPEGVGTLYLHGVMLAPDPNNPTTLAESTPVEYPLTPSTVRIAGMPLLEPLPGVWGIERDVIPKIDANVEYELRGRRTADLALRLYFEKGADEVFLASSEFLEVKRSDGLATKPMTIYRNAELPGSLHGGELVAIPEEATRLFLKAVLIDRQAQTVLAESYPLDYNVAPYDIEVDHVEVVQIVQTKSNGVPLSKGKRAIVRVFPKHNHDLLIKKPKVTGVLKMANRSGRLVELPPFNRPVVVTKDPDRDDKNSSLNFYLPRDYIGIVRAKQLDITAELRSPPGKSMPIRIENGKNPYHVSLPVSELDLSLKVYYVSYCYQPTGLAQPACTGRNLANLHGFMQKVYPAPRRNITYEALPIPPSIGNQWIWRPSLRHEANQKRFLQMISQIYNSTVGKGFHADQLVAWLPDASAVEVGLGKSRLDHLGLANTIGSGGDGRTSYVLDFTFPAKLEVAMAHEVGHNLGVDHPTTADACAPLQSPVAWPYQNATVQEPGFDPGRRKFIPRDHMDYMSACVASIGYGLWASPLHVAKLLKGGMQPTRSFDMPTPNEVEPRRRLDNQQGTHDFLLVTGSVRRDGTGGVFDSVYKLSDSYPDSPSDPSGSTCVVSSDGAVELSRHCWEPAFKTWETWFDTPRLEFEESFFSKRVPFFPGTTKLSLEKDGQPVFTSTATANAPRVQIDSPQAGTRWQGEQTLQWTTTDPDGDPVKHLVQYSPDGGQSWIPLEIDTQEKKLSMETSLMEGGANVHLRVLASDGLHTSTAQVGPITVEHRPTLGVAAEVDFGYGLLEQGSSRGLLVSNTGTGPLKVHSATTDSTQFGATLPQAGLIVWPGSPVELELSFVPEQTGEQSAMLTLASNDGSGASQTVRLRGEGIDETRPDIEAAPESLAFGDVEVGQSAEQTLTVRNHGPASLSVSSIVCSDSQFQITSGSAPFELATDDSAVSVRFSPAAAGEVSATLTIASDDPDRPNVQVALRGAGTDAGGGGSGGGTGAGGGGAGARPAISDGGVVNAASYRATLSRGSIGSIYGTDLASAVVLAENVPLPRLLGGVRVLVNGIDAPLYFVSPTQINFQVPFEVPLNGSIEIIVIRDGRSSAPATVDVAEYAPGFFTNPATGDPIAQRHPDLSVITSANPAKPNDVLIFYLSGVGGVNSLPVTGEPTGVSPVPTSRVTPTATLGGSAVNVLWSGLAPYMIGVGQLNLQLGQTISVAGLQQRAATTGVLPLVVRYGESESQEVMLPVELDVAGAPSIQVNPGALDFGDVDATAFKDLPLTIGNTGQGPLTVSSLSIGDAGFRVVSTGAPFTVLTGGQQTVTVRFEPGSAGEFLALLTIRSNDPLRPGKIVTLQGRGTSSQAGSPRMVVDPETLEFPPVLIGQSVRETATVYNMGDAPLIVTAITPGAPELSVISPPVPFTVAPGASQDVVVEFRAATDGETLAFLDMASNDPAGADYSLQVVATGMAPLETDVPSGVTMAFQTPALPEATLFNGATSVIVPPGATALDIRLEAMVPGIDVDLFVRYMEDVYIDPRGFAVTDHSVSSPGGVETLSITSNSIPPLRPGRYFIAFGKFTTGIAAEVRITATVVQGSGAGGNAVQPAPSVRSRTQLVPLVRTERLRATPAYR